MGFKETVLFLRIHLRLDFFVSFLLFLLSQKKKQEKPDGKRKKKKGFLGHACRLIKFPCVKRGEFYLLSCVTCGHSTSANSAGPNHSLRIRWFEQMVGSSRSFSTHPVRVGASTTRFRREDNILPYKNRSCFTLWEVFYDRSILRDAEDVVPYKFYFSSPKTMLFRHCFYPFSQAIRLSISSF